MHTARYARPTNTCDAKNTSSERNLYEQRLHMKCIFMKWRVFGAGHKPAAATVQLNESDFVVARLLLWRIKSVKTCISLFSQFYEIE